MKLKPFLLTILVILILGGILFASESRSLLKEGDTAPNFTSQLCTGETVSLSDYRGKNNVVLFFYPKDFTPGCTKEVCSFRDNYGEVKKYDAVLLGVSYENQSSHQSFIAKHHLPFPLISDLDKSISKAYGTATRFGGLIPGAKRVTYVIDKQGVIRSVLHHEVLIGKHLDGVMEALRKLEGGNTKS
ncbi:MAG: peroxiredoxin [Bacteroidota bacterium]